jgi:hypothetical protein
MASNAAVMSSAPNTLIGNGWREEMICSIKPRRKRRARSRR